jgi:hypothetical protein
MGSREHIIIHVISHANLGLAQLHTPRSTHHGYKRAGKRLRTIPDGKAYKTQGEIKASLQAWMEASAFTRCGATGYGHLVLGFFSRGFYKAV